MVKYHPSYATQVRRMPVLLDSKTQPSGERRPVAPASHSVTATEQQYSQREKEALAATWQYRDSTSLYMVLILLLKWTINHMSCCRAKWNTICSFCVSEDFVMESLIQNGKASTASVKMSSKERGCAKPEVVLCVHCVSHNLKKVRLDTEFWSSFQLPTSWLNCDPG